MSLDNELEKKLQKEFEEFERNGSFGGAKPILTVKEYNEQPNIEITTLDNSKREWWESSKPESEWEYDAYMDQPAEGLVMQERITYKRRNDGKIQREQVTRTFYGNNDYQDSSSTTII